MLPYTIEVTDDDAAVTAYAGLPMVVETMRMLGVSEQLDQQLGICRRNGGATDAQKAEALVLLMAAGGTCLSDMAKLRSDKGLERLLGQPLPSEQILWTYLNAFHDDALIEQAQRGRRPDQTAYIPRENGPLQALGRVNVALVRAVAMRNRITRAPRSIMTPRSPRATSKRRWRTTREGAAISRRSSTSWRPTR
jgi:hypothetical protein